MSLLSPQTPVSTLPYDILAHIVFHSQIPRATLLTLCHVSRDLHTLASGQLYRVVRIGWNELARTELFLRPVSTNAGLGQRVVSLSLATRLPDSALPAFIMALRSMLKLQHLFYVGLSRAVQLEPSIVTTIAQLSLLRSIRLRPAVRSFDDNMHKILDCLPPIERLSLEPDLARMPALERLLLRSRATLESLLIWGPYDLDGFLADEEAEGAVWTRTWELEVFCVNSPSSAKAFVNVHRLCIALPAAGVLQEASSFPNVDQLTVCATSLPATSVDQAKRHIRHLTVTVTQNSGHIDAGSLLAFMGVFSAARLRSLALDLYIEGPDHLLSLETLTAMLRQCTSLRYLGFVVNCGTQILLEMLDTSMRAFAASPLPELRFFSLRNIFRAGGFSNEPYRIRVELQAAERVARLFALLPGLSRFQFTPWSGPVTKHAVWRRGARESAGAALPATIARTHDESAQLPMNHHDIASLADLD